MNSLNSLLQNFQKLTIISFRSIIKHGGIIYYPGSKELEKPTSDFQPSKLLLVKRIKSMKGRNPEERKFLAHLNIDGDKRMHGHVNIVKNIPGINSMLWKVKHLVIIKPIRWKGELPKDGDYLGTNLRDTGELIISPKLKVTKEELESSEKYIKNDRTLKKSYLKKYLLDKWVNAYSGGV